MRSIQAMIRDPSCLNSIGIDSKMQEDCEELKIMLQNCLISSRFNQELSLQRERTPFYRRMSAKIADRPIR